MTDYSFSYSPASPSAKAPDGPLWSFHSADILPGPANTVLLHSQRSGTGMLVQPDVARALELCTHFRSLEAHTKQITEALPALRDHAQHTRQTLEHIAQQGLMESSEAAFERITAVAKTSTAELLSRLFILTCDRPDALHRLLLPLVRQALPEHVEGLWVIDDSRDEHHQQRNAAISEEANNACELPIRYFGAEARASLIEELISACPDHTSSIRWLLDRGSWGETPTYGIARNLALLLSVGTRALVMDDDTLPEAIAAPRATAPFRFADMNEREAIFYASEEDIERHALAIRGSPVEKMLDRLGTPLGATLSDLLNDHRDLQGMNGDLIKRYNAQSQVRVAQCNSWGDSGAAGSRWLLSLPDKSVQQLLETGSDLPGLLSPQHCWAGHAGPVVTPFASISQWTGLDHSASLPPYLPAGRNEDLLFGIMLQHMHPEAAVLQTDWAIRHSPVSSRSRPLMDAIKVEPGMSLLADWLGREPADQLGISAERRLVGMSEALARLAEMESDAAEVLIGRQLAGRQAAVLKQCMDHLKSLERFTELPGAESWRQFLVSSRDALMADIQAPTTNRDAIQQLLNSDILRQHAHDFAGALRAWPVICQHAQTLS